MHRHSDIFLSHSSKDKDYVDYLHGEFIKRGYRVWYDKTNINWGDNLQAKIEEGLEQSYKGIVVLSRNYLELNEWTKFEFERIIESDSIFILLHGIKIKEIETEYPSVHKYIKKILVELSISNETNLDYFFDRVKKITHDTIICGREEFARLRELLVAKAWNDADYETYRLIYEEKFGLLSFPCEDLDIINRLWFRYSNGYYGFSVQKEIYIDESKSENYSNPYKNFANRVKWYLNPYKNFARRVKWKREKGKWKSQHNPLAEPNYKGHFPAQVYFVDLGKKQPQHKFQESSNYTKLGKAKWLLGVCAVLIYAWDWGLVYFVLLVILIPSLGLGWLIVLFLVWFINLLIEFYFEFNVWDWLRDGFRSYQLHKFFSSYDPKSTTVNW